MSCPKYLAAPVISYERLEAYPTGLKPEERLRIQADRFGAPLPGLLHHVFGATGAVAAAAVPQGDQGHVGAAQGEGVVQRPEVVAPPDVVLRLPTQPGRQLL